ncbi:Transposon Ty3-I Gag-Pol polyprotein [Gossypium australe]|uniref:Transposon Ty3-I Gag-Pol polyprotein n=1 Tax=Gossypium australe TaxID=47621 RepID=A0A5B6VWJ8_9ROSI|nr:Transposon Ty3-I Gag-Pol polyprotein [Gossypium australe]
MNRKGIKNQVADHLSRLKQKDKTHSSIPIKEYFLYEHILELNYANFLASGLMSVNFTYQQRAKFLHGARYYFWEEPFLFKQCADQMIRRSIVESKVADILYHFHSSLSGGHFGGLRTAAKVLQASFFWLALFKDVYAYVKGSGRCQIVRNVTRMNEILLTNILKVDLFDVCSIDFFFPFPSSYGNRYILVAIDYVEAEAFPTNNAKIAMRFLQKDIFMRFGTSRVIISDEGYHLQNKWLKWLLEKYNKKNKVGTTYTKGQVEFAKKEIKGILEKVVHPTRKIGLGDLMKHYGPTR